MKSSESSDKIKKDDTSILVSIIVPTYKRGNAYLKRCIISLLNQTHKNIEIIIIDDNALNDEHSKKTVSIINELKDKGNIIYIKTEKNLRAALSRNLGIFAAKGDYITFLDDDDVYLPKKISIQLDYMQKEKLDMSFTDIGLYNEKDKLVDYRKHDYVKSKKNEDLIKLHVMHNLTGTPTYMFKAKSLKQIGGFDNFLLSEEYYLMEKAISSGLKIGYLPGSYVKAYRHNEGGESFSNRKITGEKELYKVKKSYFNLLNNSEKRYTRCRYFSVLAVSYYRRKNYFMFLSYSALALLGSPITLIKEILKYKRNISRL